MTLFDQTDTGMVPVNVHGSDLVFVTYSEVCVVSSGGGATERVGMAAWDPSINSIVAKWTIWDGLTDTNPSTPAVPRVPFGDPVFFPGSGMVLYSANCTTPPPPAISCTAGETVMSGVVMDELHDPEGYKYFTGVGSGWSYDPEEAALMHPVTTNGKGALSSSVGDFRSVGEDFLMFDHNSNVDASYQIWQSSILWGGWTLVAEGTMPNAFCNVAGSSGCYQLQPHPELSTASDLMVSVFDPENGGEVEISSLGALP